jgi:S1-C subfamily serine protease
VRLGLFRDGQALEVPVVLGQFDPPVPSPGEPPVAEPSGLGRLGFAATEMSGEFARRLGFGDGGVIVSRVDPAHPAGRTRLQQGVRIERVNGREVATLSDLTEAAEAVGQGEAVSLLVRGPDGGRTIINYRVGR